MRWISRIIFALLLLLFLATSTMAVRSYFRGDYYGETHNGRGWGLSSAKGYVFVDCREMDPRFTRDGSGWGTVNKVQYPTFHPPRNLAERFGFWTIDFHMGSGLANRSSGLANRSIFPYWFFVLIFGLWPAAYAMRWPRWWQARRRIARGLCRKCGYDLRESKDRCPECGMNIPTRNPKAAVC